MEDKIIDFSYKRNIGNTQTKVDCKIEVENLQKVLSISSEAIILNKEVLVGEIRFTGEVCFVCVYIDEENHTKSVRHLKEFEGKILDDSINTFTEPILFANVLDTKANQISDNQISVESIVEVSVYSFMTETFKEFDDSKSISKKMTLELHNVTKSGEARINIEEAFNLRDKPIEILSVRCGLIPKSYQTGTGYIQLDAYLIAQIVYTVDREEKTEMRSEILRRDIKEEVEIEGITKDNKIILSTDIKNCSINTKIENSQITLDIPVDIKYVILARKEREIVVDAFSPTHETQISFNSITKINKLETYATTERIDGEVEIDENETRINRILACDGNRVIVTNTIVQNNLIKIEGISYENIIYQLDDDIGNITSINAEVPFSINLEIPFIQEGDLVSINCEIIDCSNKLKKGRTIEIDNELGIHLSIVGQQYEPIIKDLNLLNQTNASESNFLIYFAKAGDTLWDVCKKLKVNQDQILLQNKDLVFPLEFDKTIVCYKKTQNKQ